MTPELNRSKHALSTRVETVDYLNKNECTRVQELAKTSPLVAQSLAQLGRILASRKFERVQQKARDLLGFVVAKKLLGHAEQIKEVTLALRVFHEATDFNPAETAKVRMAAGDVRRRLAAYAKDEGQSDPIEIVMPLNTYVPAICDRRPTVIVTELENWQVDGQRHVAVALTAEIAYLLSREGIQIEPQRDVVLARLERRYRLRGSVEGRDDVLKVNVSLAQISSGRIVLSRGFGGTRDDCFGLACTIVAALLKEFERARHGARDRSPNKSEPVESGVLYSSR